MEERDEPQDGLDVCQLRSDSRIAKEPRPYVVPPLVSFFGFMSRTLALGFFAGLADVDLVFMHSAGRPR